MNMNGTNWISHNVLTDALSASYILDQHRSIFTEKKIEVPSRAQTLSQKAYKPGVHWLAARPGHPAKATSKLKGRSC